MVSKHVNQDSRLSITVNLSSYRVYRQLSKLTNPLLRSLEIKSAAILEKNLNS